MSSILRTLLAFLLITTWSGTFAQSPQNADCGTCNCTVGSPVQQLPSIPAPACPGTSTGTVNANVCSIRFGTVAGNRYRVSLCGATAGNTVLFIRNQSNPWAVVPGACDDDGCGIPNGPSSVIFVATTNFYRAWIYDGNSIATCGNAVPGFFAHPAWAAPNSITVECLGPVGAPVNDEPCGAIALPLVNSSCSAPVVGTTDGATPSTVSSLSGAVLNPVTCPGSVNYSGGDVWYSIIVPATGYIGINTSESGVCAGALGIYTAPNCATDPFTWVNGTPMCSIDGLNGAGTAPGIVINPATNGLVAGQTIYVRYWERNNNENGLFTICAYNAPVPPGEDPCNSILLNAIDPCVPVEYNTENMQPIDPGITLSPVNPSCGYSGPAVPINDMWFRVVVPATGAMTVNTIAGTLTDMAMAFYRLTAGTGCAPSTLTQIGGTGCNDNQAGVLNKMPRINSSTAGFGLAVGETIYIRVWNLEAGNSNYYGTFSICVTPNIPPPNDDPCGAIALDVNTDCVLTPATNENATNTLTPFLPGAGQVDPPSCGGAANGDVWFTVDVPGDLIAPYGLQFDTYGLAPLDFAMAVYRDTSALGCAGTMKLVQVPGGCQAVGGQGTGSMPAVLLNVPAISPNERLYIRVWRQTLAQGLFSICVDRTDPVLCAGTYYDSGGPSANYMDNENIDIDAQSLFCPHKAGDVVTLTFLQFNIEAGWDFMRIYNGQSTAAPLIGTYTGTSSPGTITANLTGNPSGCLYVVFTSDFIITAPGYAFKVTCGPPPANSAVAGACGTVVYDPGGPSAAYPGNLGVASTGIPPWMNTTLVNYCPFNGNAIADSVITITFNNFAVETFFDGLYVFDANYPPGTPLNTPAVLATQFNSGNGPQGTWSGPYNPPTPPNGAYWGNGIIGPFTSTITAANPQGCLTLALYTDAIVAGNWQATLSCGPPPPPLPPPVGQCNILFYETPGGSTGNYANNVTSSQTICAQPGQLLTVNFELFQLENNWDKMYVFDGPNTASPMIASTNGPGFGPAPFAAGGYWGTGIPGPFTASTPGGCLTFYFVTDASVTYQGWRARTTCTAQEPNDNPCTPAGATLLNVNTTCVPQTFNNTSTTPTTGVPPPGCGNYQGGDVWFRFVAPPSGRVFIDSHAGTMTDGAMALYSAMPCPAIGPLTLVACNDDDGEGLMPQIDRMCNPLTPGQTYYLRFFGYGNQRGTFDLCLVTTGGQTTLQGDCAGAFNVCQDDPFTNAGYGSGCNADLSTVNWGCLTNGEHQGSWYAFKVANAGTLGMTITPSVTADLDWAIWQAPSAALPNPVGANCVPAAHPIRCSYASQYNTINVPVASANPGAVTGMGRATFGGAANHLLPPFPQNDNTDGWVPGIMVAPGQVYILFVDDHHLMGGSYTVDWIATPTIPGNEVIDCVLLPISLVNLEAKPQTSTVDLLWTTSTEQHSSHFLVERAADGRNFEVIGSMDAMGTRSIPTDYTFPDENPIVGMNYYRLRMVDLDGTFAYSNVVTALFQPKEVRILVVPNPMRDKADLVMSSLHDDVLHVRIMDGSGRVVASFVSPNGTQRFELPTDKLEAGSYTVQLLTRDGTTFGRTRFVKQ